MGVENYPSGSIEGEKKKVDITTTPKVDNTVIDFKQKLFESTNRKEVLAETQKRLEEEVLKIATTDKEGKSIDKVPLKLEQVMKEVLVAIINDKHTFDLSHLTIKGAEFAADEKGNKTTLLSFTIKTAPTSKDGDHTEFGYICKNGKTAVTTIDVSEWEGDGDINNENSYAYSGATKADYIDGVWHRR